MIRKNQKVNFPKIVKFIQNVLVYSLLYDNPNILGSNLTNIYFTFGFNCFYNAKVRAKASQVIGFYIKSSKKL